MTVRLCICPKDGYTWLGVSHVVACSCTARSVRLPLDNAGRGYAPGDGAWEDGISVEEHDIGTCVLGMLLEANGVLLYFCSGRFFYFYFYSLLHDIIALGRHF